MLDRGLVLPNLLAARAAATPDRVFLQDVDGREETYEALHRRNLRWANAYRRAGVMPGDTVATMLPNSFESYSAWLGLAWLHAVEVPVNRMYRGRMLRHVLDDSRSRMLVIGGEMLEALAEIASELEFLETVILVDAAETGTSLPQPIITREEFFDGVSPAGDLTGPAHHDPSGIVYTSGTTGPSKGVVVPWAASYYFSNQFPEKVLREGEAFYSFWPPFHVTGKASLYLPALRNARLVMREVFSVSEFWDDVRRYECTACYLFGPLAQLLASRPARPDDAENPLRGISGVPMIPDANDFKRRFGIEYYSTGFGQTEIGAIMLTEGWGDVDNWQTCGGLREGPPGYQARIVDDHDEPVAPGAVGELIVRTDEPWAMNTGYFADPEKTAAAWRNGWFHTGDAFRQDEEGNFYFVDRKKDALRRRGENISSFEVEAYVNEHPEVAESAAIGVPSEFGEDDVKVCVVRVEGSALTPEGLIESLIPSMPRFMVPRYVEFMDALPKTDATARTKKAELKKDPLGADVWDREHSDIELPR